MSGNLGKDKKPTRNSSRKKESPVISKRQEETSSLDQKADQYYHQRPYTPHNFHNDPAIVYGVKTNSPPVQARLNIGQPGDKYEQEADEVASKVVNTPEKQAPPPEDNGNKGAQPSNLAQPKLDIPTGKLGQRKANPANSIQNPGVNNGFKSRPFSPIQRMANAEIQQQPAEGPELQAMEMERADTMVQEKCERCGGNHKTEDHPTGPPAVQTKDGKSQTSPGLESKLNSSKGGGKPMDDSTQGFMESRMGGDFGSVNVHTDSEAVQMNQELGSQAFTHGSDIYFNQGKYQPESDSGKELLAHELTHTMQQGAAPVQKKEETAAADKEADAGPALPTTDISTAFAPGEAVATFLADNHNKYKEVPVKIGELAQGSIKVKQTKKAKENSPAAYKIKSKQGISLNGLDFLNPLRAQGLEPVVALKATDPNNITGVVSVKVKDTVAPDPKGLIKEINNNLEPLGLLGVSQLKVPNYTNEVVNGQLNLMVEDLNTSIAGYLDAGGSFGLVGGAFVFDINAQIDIAGLAQGELQISRNEEGQFAGEAMISADIANLSGQVVATYNAGDVTIQGTLGIESEKFSGSVTVMVADQKTADQTMKAELGVESLEEEQAKGPEGPEAKVKKTKKNQVFVGWGSVTARITPWLEGTANIGIDSKGQVTIVGEIVVPDEIELMEQKGKKMDLFNLEVKGGYGVPLVGQIGLFASIGMFMNAGFGPLILKDVGFKGTYSTDPSVLQNFEITGTLNIGAFAILGLEAEAGAFITLLGHDIKAGINVTAAAGIRAYAEVTPTFLYEEKAAPDGGKIGEAWLKGHFEAAAQLFLALSGAFFVELDSPWWSPAPDERWEYPLGEVEYPIGPSMGIGGDVNWLVGSPEAPELEFSPVEFDPDKFTSDIMADPPPKKGGGKGGEQENGGEWEDGSAKGNLDGDPEMKEGEGLKGKKEEEDVSKLSDNEKYMRALGKVGDIGDDSKKKPITHSVLKAKVKKIKSKYGINKMTLQDLKDGSVNVYVKHKDENNKKNLIAVTLMTEAERMKLLGDAMTDLDAQSKSKLSKEDQSLSEADAKAIAADVEKKHWVLESMTAKADGENWVFLADLGDKTQKVPGPKVAVEKVEGEEKGEGAEGAEGESLPEKPKPIKVPFTMDGKTHHIIVKEENVDAEILMASKEELLEIKWARFNESMEAYTNLPTLPGAAGDELLDILMEYQEAVDALFGLKGELTTYFQQYYDEAKAAKDKIKEGKEGTRANRTKINKRRLAQIEGLIDSAVSKLVKVSRDYGLVDLTPLALERMEIEAIVQPKRDEVQAVLDKYRTALQGLVPGGKFKYHGSLATGFRSWENKGLPLSAAARVFNPDQFDCDAFIEVDDETWAEIAGRDPVIATAGKAFVSRLTRTWAPARDILEIVEAIKKDLKKVAGYKDSAAGEPDFSFVIQPESKTKGQESYGVRYPKGSFDKAGYPFIEDSLPNAEVSVGDVKHPGKKHPDEHEDLF